MTSETVVDLLDRQEVVAIVTTRSTGDPIATPIWSVVVDGVPYLRSAFGPDSWWYQHILAGRPVAFALGDGHLAEQDREAALELPRAAVTASYVPEDDPVQESIDEALAAKYPAGGPLDSMVTDLARSCTLRVEAP